MPDNGDQKTFVNQYRRKTLLSGAAFLSVNLAASPSLACGGGPDPDSASDGQSSRAKKRPQVIAPYKESFTQRQFRNLSAADLREHSIDSSQNRSTLKIEGFSPRMTRILFDMAGHDRTSTRRLVKDMAKLKTEKARKAHLKTEIKRSKELHRTLKKSIKTLKKNKSSQAAIDDANTRGVDNSYYVGLVRRWALNPMEGTLK